VSDALGNRAEAVLAAALEVLIPGDEHGPGAREAGVGVYVEGALARAGADTRARWRTALEALDDLASARAGTAFATLGADAQSRLLEHVAGGTDPAAVPSPAFFEELRQRAIEGLFGDPAWGGNVDRAGWRLLGYSGPQPVWSADEQRVSASEARP
jgi:gluconate 2-dehydrogenase gamma chain